ncbi:hypothetical protein F4861DRAFT_510135 [Xylaria intraflava]|nr:hypothetical protein F4861DRAFT_510135 [Xylaria intraflava]
MYRNNSYSSSHSGPPPPQPRRPPGYDHYDTYQPPPPSVLPPPPPPPTTQWDRRDARDGQFRGPYSDLRQSRRDSRHDYQPPRGEFTFRQEAPPGIDSYRPPPPLHYGDRDGGSTYAPRRDESRRTRGGQRPDRPRRTAAQPHDRGKAALRPLLSTRFNDKPELMLGNAAIRATYKDVDELSDSDEVDMDISDNGDSDSNAPDRPAKRARTTDSEQTTAPSAPSAPRWSNPDPYTALPPPETTRKKDVVQLIRKARVQAEAKQQTAPSEAADFISCDFTDDEAPSRRRDRQTAGVEVKSGHLQPTTKPVEPIQPTNSHAAPSTLPSRPPTSTQAHDLQRSSTSQDVESAVDLAPSTNLGNRKRTIDDEIKSPHAPLKRANKMASSGSVVVVWQPKQGENPCPWVATDHSTTANAGTRLHKEICDFYDYVRPREYEEKLREELIEKLRALVRSKWYDAQILPFGSFMSGLYLPTADMDVAICSKSFTDGRFPVYDKKKYLFHMKHHIEIHGVAAGNQVEAITRAKVPLLKYCDDYTGLKVDISFEKMDGYKAIKTFLKWKEQYPCMPHLVAMIKQFLLMRSLNEPVNGGIGGFSVICMVVHILQMMPQIQSRAMKGGNYLGDLLMEFLDYYGNQFKYEMVAIRMNPPGLVNKAGPSTVVYRNLDRLSIIDPNNPENDIAGGSSNYHTIKDRFSKAYSDLKKAMLRSTREATSGNPSGSVEDTLLYPLLAGNYSHFRYQRDWLEKLSSENSSDHWSPPGNQARTARDGVW